MTTYISVCRSDTIGFVSAEARETFERAMRQALGYVRIKLSSRLATGAYLVTTAPLGAVTNEADADRLIAELRRMLSHMSFCMTVKSFDAAAFLLARAPLAAQETRPAARVA